MTSPTAKTDTSIGNWKWVASWKEEYVRDDGSETTGGTKLEPVTYMTLADAQAIIDGYGVSA